MTSRGFKPFVQGLGFMATFNIILWQMETVPSKTVLTLLSKKNYVVSISVRISNQWKGSLLILYIYLGFLVTSLQYGRQLFFSI